MLEDQIMDPERPRSETSWSNVRSRRTILVELTIMDITFNNKNVDICEIICNLVTLNLSEGDVQVNLTSPKVRDQGISRGGGEKKYQLPTFYQRNLKQTTPTLKSNRI